MEPETRLPPEELSAFLDWVVDSGVLSANLVDTSAPGADESELAAAELPHELAELLRRRNGWNLDVIRIHGLAGAQFPLRRTRTGLVFASDPAGFWHEIRKDGVFEVDHDGGEEKYVAVDLYDFFCSFVFGPRAAEFAGQEWADQVNERIWGFKQSH